MEPGPAVTVVVPVYRNRETVVPALKSVKAQSLTPAAVIVVDDGSDDGSGDLVASDFPEVELVRQPNRGPAAARNAGWQRARTDWVAFLDADDLWEPEKLQAQLAVANELSGATIVACDWLAPGAAAPTSHRGPVTRRLSPLDILVLNRFQTSTVLARRAVLEETGGFDPDLDGAEDWDLWLRCARHGGVLKLGRPLVRYRDTAESYSKNGERVRAAMRAMLDRELPLSGLSARRQAEVRAWHELRFAVGFTMQHQPDLARAAIAELRSERLIRASPGAVVRYLAPWLVRRRLRRLRPVQPLRLRRSP